MMANVNGDTSVRGAAGRQAGRRGVRQGAGGGWHDLGARLEPRYRPPPSSARLYCLHPPLLYNVVHLLYNIPYHAILVLLPYTRAINTLCLVLQDEDKNRQSYLTLFYRNLYFAYYIKIGLLSILWVESCFRST